MPDPAGLEVANVTAWLAEQLQLRPPLHFERIAGGHSNLTYRVTDNDGRLVVLRRPPMGHLLPTAHDMSREHRIISGLASTAVPVPTPLAFCPDETVTGAPFYVMEFVDGHVLHTAEVARSVFDGGQRRRTGESYIDALAELHSVVPADVGLDDLGRHEGYIARQLKRWYSQWEQSKTRELPGVDELHTFLSARIPDQGPARVVHGDYRLGNCIADRDTGELRAILDWEIATLGDPLADLGYVLATWSERTDPHPSPGVPSMVEGFPTRAELVERYVAKSGRDVSTIDFYVSFSHWKGACITEGVYARYLQGALDTTGVDLHTFPRSVERAVQLAQEAAARVSRRSVGGAPR